MNKISMLGSPNVPLNVKTVQKIWKIRALVFKLEGKTLQTGALFVNFLRMGTFFVQIT